MKATIRLVVLTAARDRLFAGLVLFLLCGSALGVFLGGTVLIEQLETAVVIAAGVGRLVLILGLTIFAALHIQNLFESREVEAILSRSISRFQFVIAYWIGLVVIAAVLTALFTIVIALFTKMSAGTFLWGGTVAAEAMIVLAVAIFAGLMLERATPTVLFTLGFYGLSRLMGFFVGIRETASDFNMASTVIKRGLDVILLFIPRLDLFAQSRWLVYGAAQFDLALVAGQTVVFLALVLLAASYDLSRKQF